MRQHNNGRQGKPSTTIGSGNYLSNSTKFSLPTSIFYDDPRKVKLTSRFRMKGNRNDCIVCIYK